MADKITIDQIRARRIEDADSSIGSGFLWPTEIDDDGTIKVASGLDHIASCIKRIIYYKHGDMIGMWSFGGGLGGRLFTVSSGSLSSEIKEEITNALTKYEPRISDFRITVANKESDLQTLVVVLQYRVNTTGEYSNLVFPIPKE
jgi:phage baseplate assembly protein W